MRRTARLLPLLLLALPAGAQAATPAPPTAVPTLGVRLAGCQVGTAADDRGADFEGAMPASPGSSVLAMRFDLEQRRGAVSWKPVTGVPGFGRYERSAAGAAGFVFSKRFERLVPGASYRVTVRFRWSDADGAVLKRATRRSPTCRQTDLRPDLTVAGVTTGEPTADGRAHYVVQVSNDGLSALTGALRVGLTVDGLALPSLTLPGLAAGGVGEVGFDGPVCRPGARVVATADPDDDLDEPTESDNTLAVDCPA